MTTPTVSVLIPTFNRLPCLRRALRSVEAQTYRDFEVVVADDASTDGTSAWLARRASPRLRCVRLARNGGTAAARNRAYAEARGEFIALLDSDDLWRPGFLKALLPAFRRPAVMVATSNYEVIDARGRRLERRGLRPTITTDPVMRIVAGLGFVPLPSASIVRRTVFETVGVFDPHIRLNDEDQDFWYRVGQEFGSPAFHFLDRPLASYRRHAEQTTAYQNRAGHPWWRRGQWPTLSAKDRDIIFSQLCFLRKHRTLIDFSWGLL
jgi:glycosyltransferase involved in cell wall biosynthesis